MRIKANKFSEIDQEIRKKERRVSNSSKYMKEIVMIGVGSITVKTEQLLEHVTVNTWTI